MSKSAFIKALAISAAITTIILAVLGGYSSSTTPDGITTHHYTLSWLSVWLPLLGMFVFPATFVVGYPVSLLLYKVKLFNIYVVSLVGVAGAIAVVSVLFSKYPLAPMLALYYGTGGFVASVTAFVAYKNLTKVSI